MLRRAVATVVAGTVVTLGITACGAASSGSTSSSTYVIGASLPESGPNAPYAKVFTPAIQAGAQYAEAQHLVSHLSVKYADNQALPQPGVAAFNQLVQVDHANYVLSTFSGVTKAAGPLANRDHVFQVNGGAVSPDLAHLGSYTVNVIPLINDEISTLLPYLKSKGYRSMDVVYTNDALGQGADQVINSSWPAKGGIVKNGYQISPTDTDLTSVATKIANDHVDVVYIASYGDQEITLVKQLRNAGVTSQMASYSAFNFPGALSAPADQGLIFTSEKVNLKASNDVTTGFLKLWMKSNSAPPSYYQVNYANAVILYAHLVKYLTAHHEAVSGKDLLSAFHAKHTYDLIGGDLTFRSNGTIEMPIEINQIHNGSFTVLK